MRATLLLLLATLAACDAAPSGDSDTSADEAPCATLETARYRANGSCFGMAMSVDLAFDEGTCAFTLDNWSMNHGDTVLGGTLDAATVTLSGNGWDDCSGEVDGDTLAGSCADDGCAWELRLL